MAEFTFDELKLTDDMVLIHVWMHRRFVCTRCGSRTVMITLSGATFGIKETGKDRFD